MIERGGIWRKVRTTLFAAPLLFALTTACQAADIAGVELTLPAKERAVQVIYFRAPGDAARPAALILHGAGGLKRGSGRYEQYASAIANEGIDAYVVRYYSEADEAYNVFEACYEDWAHLVDDVADHVLTLPKSNGKVGLIGFSNGGILATGAGSLDPKIAAAVIYYGTEPWPLQERATWFPPLLILHGDADVIIPVEEGERLEKAARRLGGEAELVIYPGAKHGFGMTMSDPASADSYKRTVAFLKKHMTPGN